MTTNPNIIKSFEHEPARVVEIDERPLRRRSHTAQELRELIQGNWADRERERLMRTWNRS
jgi:hypothetical protein